MKNLNYNNISHVRKNLYTFIKYTFNSSVVAYEGDKLTSNTISSREL